MSDITLLLLVSCENKLYPEHKLVELAETVGTVLRHMVRKRSRSSMCCNKISGKTSATANTIATDLVKAFSHPEEKTIPRHRTINLPHVFL
ncbi:hypothetical protein [Anaplasma phagocytophilum]|uniref:hypothetical protein n=1 Tax=Anaplasma phagocytophilum TaxID=948 RepID=UPI0016513DDE|nr:hypothetical protein [Anaplasma phagocytophilum]